MRPIFRASICLAFSLTVLIAFSDRTPGPVLAEGPRYALALATATIAAVGLAGPTLILVVAAVTLTACGLSSRPLTGSDTRCRDFLAANATERIRVVRVVLAERGSSIPDQATVTDALTRVAAGCEDRQDDPVGLVYAP